MLSNMVLPDRKYPLSSYFGKTSMRISSESSQELVTKGFDNRFECYKMINSITGSQKVRMAKPKMSKVNSVQNLKIMQPSIQNTNYETSLQERQKIEASKKLKERNNIVTSEILTFNEKLDAYDTSINSSVKRFKLNNELSNKNKKISFNLKSRPGRNIKV